MPGSHLFPANLLSIHPWIWAYLGSKNAAISMLTQTQSSGARCKIHIIESFVPLSQRLGDIKGLNWRLADVSSAHRGTRIASTLSSTTNGAGSLNKGSQEIKDPG
ncbi:hypothetical protein J7T55_001622 [Diaporthe amygdali]|uniref:uncharacterized protein n=1 Tax=Phomopsis amygdali TaxID=1214568 RepID=UPI0022FE70D6|nr:uncharacterized protein J7T55_001622 [Diaporthe amygdali]KAJ0115212.1 hypothetical protein J7T55_001622 [Diaporthe amygdali]